MRIYVSDLDGTLLNGNAEISRESIGIINSLVGRGLNFTIATARTTATALSILSGVDLRLPVILMNGALVYDVPQGKYVKTETIQGNGVKAVLSAMRASGTPAFMYVFEGDSVVTCFENLDSPYMKEFYEQRTRKYNRPFVRTPSFEDAADKNTFYFTFLDTKERIEKIRMLIHNIQGLSYSAYPDTYSDGLWFLEVYSEKASKYNGVIFLRKYLFDDDVVVTGIGDNLNDIPLFQACDEKVAVANACGELKLIADRIIDSNENNGVAHFLAGENPFDEL